jgi:hypothetical protein
MTKEQRLAYMRKRFPQLEQDRVDVVLSVSKAELDAEMKDMDTYREFARDKASVKEALTSDEG